MTSTAVIHLHVVTTLGQHIPNALVHITGEAGLLPNGYPNAVDMSASAGADGVAEFNVGDFVFGGPVHLVVLVKTPRGKEFVGDLLDYFAPVIRQDISPQIVIPNADDEGSTAADLAAWWGGFSGTGKAAIIAGAAVAVGAVSYVGYKAYKDR